MGREQAGIRAALVISHDRFNKLPNGLHIVVPITGTDRVLAYHVPVSAPDGDLTKDSQIMCEQENSQSIDRRGTVSEQALRRRQAIVAALTDR